MDPAAIPRARRSTIPARRRCQPRCPDRASTATSRARQSHQQVVIAVGSVLLLANGRLKLLVFNTDNEVIQRWTPEPPTVK